MKKLIYILLVFCVSLNSCERKSGRGVANCNKVTSKSATTSSQSEYDYFITVIGIIDGDTFKGLTLDKIELSFRLQGIDAPEKKQAFSTKSKEKLSELIYGKHVGIKMHSKDRYGRLVVYVFTPDGLDVGAEMLKSGMAWHYKKYDNSDLYNLLEIEARNSRVGLWQDDDQIPPWDYRQR